MADDNEDVQVADPEEDRALGPDEQVLPPEVKAALIDATIHQMTGLEGQAAGVAPPTAPIGSAPQIINRGGQVSPGPTLVAPPPVPPQNQGRMYMGPAMSQSQEQAFMQSPAGTRILPPPPSPEQQSAMQDQRAAALESVPGAQNMEDVDTWNRVAANDVLGASRTLPGVSRPEMPTPSLAQQQYDARQKIEAAVAKGMKPADAMAAFGQGLFAPGKGQMTEYQQAQLDRQKLLDAKKAEDPKVLPPSSTKIPGVGTVIQVPGSKAWRLVNESTGQTKPFTPAQAASILAKGKAGQLEMTPAMVQELKKILVSGLPQAASTATGTTPPPVNPPQGAAPAATSRSPFKEGQIVRDKKTGKRYKIVNGEPVEV